LCCAFRLISSTPEILEPTEWLWMDRSWDEALERLWFSLLNQLVENSGSDVSESIFTPELFLDEPFIPGSLLFRQPPLIRLWLKMRRLQNAMRYNMTYYFSQLDRLPPDLIRTSRAAHAFRRVVKRLINLIPQFSQRMACDVCVLSKSGFDDFNSPVEVPDEYVLAFHMEYLSFYITPLLIANMSVPESDEKIRQDIEIGAISLCRIATTRGSVWVASTIRDLFIAGLVLTSRHHPSGMQNTSRN
jgi:hypothetical protein